MSSRRLVQRDSSFFIPSDFIHLSILVYSINNLFIHRKFLSSKPIFEVMKQKKVTRGQIWGIGWVGKYIGNSKPNSCTFAIATTDVCIYCPGARALFCALILVASLSIYHSNAPITLHNTGQSLFYPFI